MLELELIKAVDLKDIERVKELIANGVDVNSYKGQAIRQACLDGQLDIVNALIKAGADVNVEKNDCIRWACTMGFVDVIKVLIAAGSAIHKACLGDACTSGHLDVVNLLIDHGVDVNLDYDQAICYAAINGHTSIVVRLLEFAYQDKPCPKELEEYWCFMTGRAWPERESFSKLTTSEVKDLLVAAVIKKEIMEL